ncbi:hypothetical protein [Comamonas odontotermitis]|uniref:hypothetical protein n=1 Tax=Comamonas odontotermitis TaxID=379895 RepID=UPI001CC657F4|nr:hypothetical protein [Comamonas odontotermitis]UBB18677.1 hypothetical protein LAD35_08655 [Comamonas odontotermitis]
MSAFPSTRTTPVSPSMACVHVVACAVEDACALAASLQHALGAEDCFHFRPGAAMQLDARALGATDALLLLTPPLSASNTQVQHAQDALMQLRADLVSQRQPFQVLFSQGTRLLDDALTALCNWFPQAPALQARRSALREHGNLTRWSWNCEKCSDPECEFRLFKGLTSSESP